MRIAMRAAIGLLIGWALVWLVTYYIVGVEKDDFPGGRAAIFSYYDPTLPEPERWETKNMLIQVGVTDLRDELGISYKDKVRERLAKSMCAGLFRWPISLSDGSKAWDINDLDQVRTE